MEVLHEEQELQIITFFFSMNFNVMSPSCPELSEL